MRKWLVMATVAIALVGMWAALLAGGAIYQWRGARRDARRLPPPGRVIDAGARRLHLYCLGEGRLSVIFEAGLAASSLNWRALQQDVSRFTRACAYDRAGYGWSARARGRRSARAAAADLHALLTASGVPPPYLLIAHSFGTYVARVFAAEHASMLAGVVLLDPITAEEWRAPDREHRRLLLGGRLVSHVGAVLASVGVVRFLLNRLPPNGPEPEGGSASASPASSVSRPSSSRSPSSPSSSLSEAPPSSSPSSSSPSPSSSSSASASRRGLPAAVLGLFGREVDTAVRRMLGEVTKMPRAVWPEVQSHWSRTASFLTMAQHFEALAESAVEVQAATPEDGLEGDVGDQAADRRRERERSGPAVFGELPLVVISAANCPDDRVRAQGRLAALSRRGRHLRATVGGHWIHLDEPSLVIGVIRRLIDDHLRRAAAAR